MRPEQRAEMPEVSPESQPRAGRAMEGAAGGQATRPGPPAVTAMLWSPGREGAMFATLPVSGRLTAASAAAEADVAAAGVAEATRVATVVSAVRADRVACHSLTPSSRPFHSLPSLEKASKSSTMA